MKQEKYMKATFLYEANDVRVVEIPKPTLMYNTDAVLRVVAACVCGSDLHPYHNAKFDEVGEAMGHEVIGVITELGSEVRNFSIGDLVVVPFSLSDNTCEYCLDGNQTSCIHGEFLEGAQAEYVRVAQASGSMVKLPVTEDSPLIPSLLTLSDVYGTGYHAAIKGGVDASKTVTVIGDGAVGLLAVMSAKKLGAKRIILMGRHKVRTDLGVEFGANDVISERGDEGIKKLMEITNGVGTDVVIEAVGYLDAYEMALGVVRHGGVISRVGVPQYKMGPIGYSSLFSHNITLTGGLAPTRNYIHELMPDILDGKLNPGKVFDLTLGLDHVKEAYEAMNTRKAIKVLIKP